MSVSQDIISGQGVVAKSLTTLVIFCAFAGLAVLGWYASEENSNKSQNVDIPFIRADKTPFKVNPVDPGGMRVNNTDIKLYDEITGARNIYDGQNISEKITMVDSASEPVKIKIRRDDSQNEVKTLLIDNEGNVQKTKESVLDTVNKANSLIDSVVEIVPKNNLVNVITPPKDVVTPKVEKIIIDQPTAEPVIEDAPKIIQKVKNEVQEVIEPEKQFEVSTIKIAGSKYNRVELSKILDKPDYTGRKTSVKKIATAKTKQYVTKKPPAKHSVTKLKKMAIVNDKPLSKNSHKIQLGSFRTTKSLRKNWSTIRKKFPKELSKLQYVVNKADLGAKGIYYRLNVGPFSSESAARKICKKLKNRGQACLLAR